MDIWMTYPLIVIENVRSAYNVGNIIRTADALGYHVVLSGYTASPDTDHRIHKTALGAQDNLEIIHFWDTKEALGYCRTQGYILLAGELCAGSQRLDKLDHILDIKQHKIALIVGNEVSGVLPETLKLVDHIIHIPMDGYKESLNVGQAAAILMWHCKYLSNLQVR